MTATTAIKLREFLVVYLVSYLRIWDGTEPPQWMEYSGVYKAKSIHEARKQFRAEVGRQCTVGRHIETREIA